VRLEELELSVGWRDAVTEVDRAEGLGGFALIPRQQEATE
jgi:hypothetical protein